jgi:hypothetical protein
MLMDQFSVEAFLHARVPKLPEARSGAKMTTQKREPKPSAALAVLVFSFKI